MVEDLKNKISLENRNITKIVIELFGITKNIQVVKKLISQQSYKFKHQPRQPAKSLFSLFMIMKQIARSGEEMQNPN